MKISIHRYANMHVALVALAALGACERSTKRTESASNEHDGTAQARQKQAPPAAGQHDDAALAPRSNPATTRHAMDPQLTWNMNVSGKTLRLTYTVTNPGASPIWMVDDLLRWARTAFERAPNAMVVRNGDVPGTVSFYRGMMDIPSREMRMYPSPGVRKIEPGQALTTTVETALPLSSWHNYHPKKMKPLDGAPTKVMLEVQYLDTWGKNTDWDRITLQDGSQTNTPLLRFLNTNAKLLRSQPQPVPTTR